MMKNKFLINVSLISIIIFFVFSISINTTKAIGETVSISVNPKPDGNLGININGLFKTAEKIDSGTIHYTIGIDPKTYASDTIFSEKLENSTITTTTEGGKTIYNYSFGQQLYKFSKDKKYYDVVKGDTYYARAVIIAPKGDGTNLKYESSIVPFVAGTPSTTGTSVVEEGKDASQAAYDKAYNDAIARGKSETEAREAGFLAAQGVGNEKPTGNKDDAISVTPKIGATENNNVYKLLVPLPGITCMDNTGQNKECIGNNIGKYLNLIFKIGIGLCAALAVVMLIIYGVVYMGDESVFGKTEAKHKMLGAITGLIIAVGGWVLLNTINPDLTGKNGLEIDSVIVNFEVSGSSTFDGKPIQIDFNTQAYPAAKFASEKTGVETAFILAMFAQETSNGSNTGTCNYLTANMESGQLEALKTVAAKLNLNYTTINMSCSGGGSTHGGAIGFTQFLPGTWLEYSDQAKQILGHEPDPWNTADALMMTALFLKSKGGAGSNIANQEAAACKYFGSCNVIVSCGGGVNGTYGQCILGKKVSIQQQIDESIKKGKIQ